MSLKTSKNAKPAELAESPYEAFKRLAYTFGVDELSQLMGCKKGTLYNKADADIETAHQPNLHDVIVITRATGDFSVIEALERQFGRVGYSCTEGGASNDAALLELICTVGSKNGKMHQALSAALEDGNFEDAEIDQVLHECFDLVQATLCFAQRIKGMRHGK